LHQRRPVAVWGDIQRDEVVNQPPTICGESRLIRPRQKALGELSELVDAAGRRTGLELRDEVRQFGIEREIGNVNKRFGPG
jgi:hypothetical protein